MGRKKKNPRRRKVERKGQPPPPDLPSLCSSNEEKDKEQERKGKRIYFCIQDADQYGDAESVWPGICEGFAANPGRLSPTPVMLPPDVDALGSAVVALDSFIYVLGGYSYGIDRSSSDVLYLDTRRPYEGWKKAPSMLVARRKAAAYVVDGRIYVIGGLSFESYPFAEVFDPRSGGGWEVLNNDKTDRVFPVISDDYGDTRKLLFITRQGKVSLKSYDVDEQRWSTLVDGFGRVVGDSSCVVGGVLYCWDLYALKVFAYDLVELKWFPKPIEVDAKYKLPGEGDIASIFPLGDSKFFLVWSFGRVSEVHLGCIVFVVHNRPSVDGEASSVVVTVESQSFYDISFFNCFHCVAI